jgi:hypothetical protein
VAPEKKQQALLIALAAATAAAAGALYLAINLYYTGGSFAFPLDDAYIFLHYARHFAAGHPFEYNVGDPTTTGATSYLYLLLLTPFALLIRSPAGFAAVAYGLGTLCYGLSVYLFGKLAARLFAGRYVLLSTLVFATTGVVTFHYFTGMDTGFFTLALLAAVYGYARYLDSGRRGLFVAALALLPFARPEGAAAAVILAALALLGRAPARGDGVARKPWGVVLAALTTVPLYFAANYVVGGYVTSAGLLSKSVLAPSSEPWTLRFGDILAYAFFVVKSVFSGLDGIYLRKAINANSTYVAAAYFAPLALAFFLVGWGRAARKSWFDGRPNVAFAAGVVFLAGVAASVIALPFPRHFARYLAPFVPLFLLGVLGGVEGLAQLIRYGRPSISHRAMFGTGAAYFLCFGVLSSAYAWVLYGMSARDIRYQHLTVARYLAAETPPGANVFTNDVGALAFYSGRRIVDLEGLVTRDGWRYGPEGPGAAAEMFRRFGRPGDYFAGYLNWYGLDETGVLAPASFTATLYATAMAGGPTFSVAAIMPVVFERWPPPAAAGGTERWTLRDELNVAEAADERAHGYRLRRRAGNALPSFAAVLPWTGDGRSLFEAGRIVCGREEFDVAATPGKDLWAVVRCQPPYRAEVYCDGFHVGRWALDAGDADAFADAAFLIPRGYVRTPRLHLRLDATGSGLETNRPVHYYFYEAAR